MKKEKDVSDEAKSAVRSSSSSNSSTQPDCWKKIELKKEKKKPNRSRPGFTDYLSETPGLKMEFSGQFIWNRNTLKHDVIMSVRCFA